MNAKKLSAVMLGLALSVSLMAPVRAADKKTDKKAPEMSEEMKAQMAKAKELGTPGAEHAVLKVLEGNWTVTSKSWMKPKEKPQMSSGTSTIGWVLGGRFLKQDYKGEMMGQPFEGIGYLGYDKVKKEYDNIWLDNMATGIFQGSGQYDAATKTLTQSGTFSCPFTGQKDMWYRWEWKILTNDSNTFSMFMKDKDGKEFKSMEMLYKRAK